MTRINLLPWREALRKERQRQFFSILGGASILMGAAIFYAHIHMAGMIGAQNSRNDFLNSEIAKVDKKIKEIRELKSQKEQLLARMNIIQDLQSRRPQVVHLFDEIAKTVPEGVYLTNLKQQGNSIVVQGVAQSNSRVSTFMKNLDDSAWFSDPVLTVIQAKSQDLARVSEFNLQVKQITQQEDSGAEAG